jgi:hypothetical protein
MTVRVMYLYADNDGGPIKLWPSPMDGSGKRVLVMDADEARELLTDARDTHAEMIDYEMKDRHKNYHRNAMNDLDEIIAALDAAKGDGDDR